jgi:transcription elongation GreA/GreB family factor
MRANTGGKDGSTGMPPPALPDLPISPHANLVTASGLAQLQARREDALLRLDTLEAGDTLGRDYLARHLRWLEARIETAVPVGTRLENRDRVGFGARVELRHADGRQERLRIVGEDEAEPLHGLLSWVSPLARALEGARAGDRLQWRRADDELEVELLEVEYPDEPGARH